MCEEILMNGLLRCSSQRRRRSNVNPGIRVKKCTALRHVFLAGWKSLQAVQNQREVSVFGMAPQRTASAFFFFFFYHRLHISLSTACSMFADTLNGLDYGCKRTAWGRIMAESMGLYKHEQWKQTRAI